MKMIIKERGWGKTTELIYTSEVTGFRILTPTRSMAQYIMEKADKLHCIIPTPMQYNDYIKTKEHHDKGLLLDEIKYMFDDILDNYFGVHVYAGTMSNNN